ncbi:hypothetical protein ACFO8O_10680 [Hephaestia sp. GCM10023244]|uniref:hypothetical protein n=1 Tax=unclassified Hephaestia TaxID=2631281 RepID=UPI0020776B2D|nr:hypothetical protein [Hephaestia sp. MAHUQ-44]MCM8731424.1 hypothetical protein [Hephaestia sp. MAHUQ-44]
MFLLALAASTANIADCVKAVHTRTDIKTQCAAAHDPEGLWNGNIEPPPCREAKTLGRAFDNWPDGIPRDVAMRQFDEAAKLCVDYRESELPGTAVDRLWN